MTENEYSDDQAFAEGQAAFKNQRSLKANPYAYGSIEHAKWAQGWFYAMNEQEMSNEK